jgi:carboxyl-terminal processing protease
MPLRNLLLLALAAIISLASYTTHDHNRYSSILTELMSVVEANYVEPVDRRTLFEHAMEGMISGLDPYSAYIPPEEYLAFRENIEQKFGGIGILVEINPQTKRLTVMSPLFGTPAHKAGIQSGDTILAIDGQDTEGMNLRDAVAVMRGDPDTELTLSVLHLGEEEPVELSLKRTIIHTETVLGDKRVPGAKWDYHLQEDPRIALLRITSFGDDTAQEIRAALTTEDGKPRDFEAVILDLRGDPGGTLGAAVEICDMFIDGGVIVTTRGRDGEVRAAYEATPKMLIPKDIPMAVLVNRYSASASEIVAACLQDHKRAVVIGERTWGKGTVQNVIVLEGGRSAVRLTTSSYWRPSNRNIHRTAKSKESDTWGVLPDEGFEVKLTDEELAKILETRSAKDLYRPYAKTPETEKPTEDKQPETTPPESDSKPTEPTEPKDNGEEKSTADEKADADAPLDDPQLRKAIEYLQQRLRGEAAAA